MDWTVGTMLLEEVVLAAGVEALVGERGAEVPLMVGGCEALEHDC